MAEALARLRQWAATLRRQVMVLWFASRHPDMPAGARWLVLLVVAYALSPIDLIPDFIPLLGYLDDLLLLPLGLWLALRLTPPAVLAAAREQAEQWAQQRAARPVSRLAAAVVVLIWLGLGGLLWWAGRGRWW